MLTHRHRQEMYAAGFRRQSSRLLSCPYSTLEKGWARIHRTTSSAVWYASGCRGGACGEPSRAGIRRSAPRAPQRRLPRAPRRSRSPEPCHSHLPSHRGSSLWTLVVTDHCVSDPLRSGRYRAWSGATRRKVVLPEGPCDTGERQARRSCPGLGALRRESHFGARLRRRAARSLVAGCTSRVASSQAGATRAARATVNR